MGEKKYSKWHPLVVISAFHQQEVIESTKWEESAEPVKVLLKWILTETAA